MVPPNSKRLQKSKRPVRQHRAMHATTLFPAPAAGVLALFEVVFDYGEHDSEAPAPEDPPATK